MIPAKVFSLIRLHAFRIREFNAQLMTVRRMPNAGRYEWEYRLQHEPAVLASVARLTDIETLAVHKGICPDALYAHVGGKPELLPWSTDALTWRRPAA